MNIETFFSEQQKLIQALITKNREEFGISDNFPLYKVTPNSIHKLIGWKDDSPIIEVTFYTENHIAYTLFPKRSEEVFSSHPVRLLTGTFNPAAGERMGRKSNVGTWAGARGAATSDGDTAVCEVSSQLNGGTYYNYRLFQPFDTSSLTTSAIVSAANWQGYRDDSQEIGANGAQDTDSTTLEVVVSTEADPTSYASSDYANVSFTSKGSLAFSSIGSNGAYINSGNGVSITDNTIISLTGYTKLAIITGRDLSNTAPTGLNCQSFQNRASGNPPKLVVTYTLKPSSGFFNFFN